jgi:dTDP-4-amino-4,6-dideoxygalactose transaminase
MKLILPQKNYEDLSDSLAGKIYGIMKTECQNALQFAQKILRLPNYVQLSEQSVSEIIKHVLNALLRKK